MTKKTLLLFSLLLFVGALILTAPPMAEAQLFAVGYVIAISLFLGVQVYGFILSQVDVSREVERPKIEMLEEEVREWAD